MSFPLPRVRRRPRLSSLLFVAGVSLAACSRGSEDAGQAEAPAKDEKLAARESCPDAPRFEHRFENVPTRYDQLETWVEAIGSSEAKRVLLDDAEIAELNRRASEIDGAWRDPWRAEAPIEAGGELPRGVTVDPEKVAAEIEERLVWMGAQVADAAYEQAVEGSWDRAAARARASQPVDELRWIAAEASLRCAPADPEEGLFKPPRDPDFDRNNCASLHPGEWVRVLRRGAADDDDWYYVHAGHTVGWLHAPKWTPPVDDPTRARLAAAPRVFPLRDDLRTQGGVALRLGAAFRLRGKPDADPLELWVPGPEGVVDDEVAAAEVSVGPFPLTRERAWSWALAELGASYGWGGRAGERDCSRLLRDVFVGMGLELARHSGVQAKLGTERIDVAGVDEATKRRIIDEAAARGLLLLYMPGHIMLYVGRDGDRQFAVSSISEYLTPCEGGPDTVHRLDRVVVSDLEVGRGSARRSFIERIDTLVVFGRDTTRSAPGDDGPGDDGPGSDSAR